MSIEGIEVSGPNIRHGAGYGSGHVVDGTNSGVELDVAYSVFCPLGHAVGRRWHVLDLCLSDGGMSTLAREGSFQCAKCGVCFMLTANDLERVGSMLAARCGT